MSKNPNVKSNDDGDEEDDDDDVDNDDGGDDEILRRGCCVKRLTRHMVRIPFDKGGGSDCCCDMTPAWVVHEPWTGIKLDIHS